MARRKLVWARMAPAMTTLNVVANTVGGAIETQDLLSTFRTQAGLIRGPVGLTVMRVRLTFHWSGDASQYTDMAVSPLYFGLKVQDYQAAVAEEAAEIPTRGPQLDPHADWMAWGQLPWKETTQDSSGNVTGILGWHEVDVRSMRKIDELGQTLVLLVQGTASAETIGGPAYAMVVSSSVLVALP